MKWGECAIVAATSAPGADSDMEWSKLLDKYGWPAIGLSLFILFFWKAVWPLFLKWFEAEQEQRKRDDIVRHEQLKTMESQVQRSEARTQVLTDSFLKSLNEMHALNDRLQDANETMNQELKRMNTYLDDLRPSK